MFLLLSPILVPFLTAIGTLFVRRSRKTQHGAALLGASLHLVCAGLLFTEILSADGPTVVGMGDWQPPIGIAVVADTLSASLTLITAWVHFTITAYGISSSDEDRRRSEFWPLLNTMVMGVQGAFLTGDLFNLYVWFEVLLISSFVLVAIGNSPSQIRAAVRYVVINLVSSACFLTAIALLYGLTGSLNLADISQRLANEDPSPLFSAVAWLFVVGFGIKSAMVPLSIWLPSAYQAPPAVLSAILASLLTKVGIYSFLRVGTLFLIPLIDEFETILLIGSALSLVVGALGAWGQTTLRGILVHTVVFAVGFMLMGIAVGTEESLTGAILYLMADMLVVSTVFVLAGEVERLTEARQLDGMGGVYQKLPWLAVSYLLVAFSICGFPPTLGFWSKLAVLSSVAASQWWWLVVVALITSCITLAAIIQSWSLGLWRPAKNPSSQYKVGLSRIVPIGLMVGLVLGLSLYPSPLVSLAQKAGAELIRTEIYIKAVGL